MILRSYGDQSRIVDVQPLVEILTAKENYFLTKLAKTSARDTVHRTMVDTLATAGTLSVEESADYTYAATTTPTFLTNIVENIARPIKVSRTQMLIQHYHNQNEKARQMTKAMEDWANGAEFDILRSTLVSGASGTTPKMNGIIAAISKATNTTVHTSTTVFSASILKGLLKGNWDNSNGESVTDLFMGSALKSVFDTFTASATKFLMASEAAVTDFKDVYDGGGFGRVMVHMHRYIQQAADPHGRILGVRPEKLALAYLEPAHLVQNLAVTGDYEPAAIVGKLTLEVKNQDTHFFASGFVT